jgi:hypothetical protein
MRVSAGYIADEFNGKRVEPVIPGDFEAFWELWLGQPYQLPDGSSNSGLFLMKSL